MPVRASLRAPLARARSRLTRAAPAPQCCTRPEADGAPSGKFNYNGELLDVAPEAAPLFKGFRVGKLKLRHNMARARRAPLGADARLAPRFLLRQLAWPHARRRRGCCCRATAAREQHPEAARAGGPLARSAPRRAAAGSEAGTP